MLITKLRRIALSLAVICSLAVTADAQKASVDHIGKDCGLNQLQAIGRPIIGESFRLRTLSRYKYNFIGIGLQTGDVKYGNQGCHLYISPLHVEFMAGSWMRWEKKFFLTDRVIHVPPDPQLVGFTFYAQAFSMKHEDIVVWPGPNLAIQLRDFLLSQADMDLSNALKITIGDH